MSLLHIHGLPRDINKSELFGMLLDTREVRKPQIGRIGIGDDDITIELPDTIGPFRILGANRPKNIVYIQRLVQCYLETGRHDAAKALLVKYPNHTGRGKRLRQYWLDSKAGAPEQRKEE